MAIYAEASTSTSTPAPEGNHAARLIRYLLAALLALPLLCCSCATTAPREAHDVRAERAHPNLATSNNPK